MLFTRIFFLCTAIVLFAAPALAQSTVWSAVAMACTPTHTTVEQNRYITTAGRVKFRPRATGNITFICPVTSQLPRGKYKISGFYSGTGSIGVQLRRAHVRSGAVSTILSGDIFFTSSNYKMSEVHNGYSQNTLSFDLRNFVYWVQITIKNNRSGAQSRAILGAALTRQ